MSSATDTTAAALPRQKPKASFRKRRRSEDGGEEGDASGGVNLEALRDLKEDQRHRAQPRGLSSTALSAGLGDDSSSNAAGASRESTAAGPGATSILGGGFRAETGGMADDENPALRAFVESRLAELQGKPAASGDGAAASGNKQQREDAWLYEMPEELRPIASRSRTDADVGEGGMMLAGTGIAEVALPVDFKLKNIEDTEKAKREYLARRGAGLPGTGPLDLDLVAGMQQARGITGSLTANYALHRREFAERVSGRTFGGADANRSASAPISGAPLPAMTAGAAAAMAAAAAGASEAEIASAAATAGAAAAAAAAAPRGGTGRPDRRYMASDDQVAATYRKREVHRNSYCQFVTWTKQSLELVRPSAEALAFPFLVATIVELLLVAEEGGGAAALIPAEHDGVGNRASFPSVAAAASHLIALHRDTFGTFPAELAALSILTSRRNLLPNASSGPMSSATESSSAAPSAPGTIPASRRRELYLSALRGDAGVQLPSAPQAPGLLASAVAAAASAPPSSSSAAAAAPRAATTLPAAPFEPATQLEFRPHARAAVDGDLLSRFLHPSSRVRVTMTPLALQLVLEFLLRSGSLFLLATLNERVSVQVVAVVPAGEPLPGQGATPAASRLAEWAAGGGASKLEVRPPTAPAVSLPGGAGALPFPGLDIVAGSLRSAERFAARAAYLKGETGSGAALGHSVRWGVLPLASDPPGGPARFYVGSQPWPIPWPDYLTSAYGRALASAAMERAAFVSSRQQQLQRRGGGSRGAGRTGEAAAAEGGDPSSSGGALDAVAAGQKRAHGDPDDATGGSIAAASSEPILLLRGVCVTATGAIAASSRDPDRGSQGGAPPQRMDHSGSKHTPSSSSSSSSHALLPSPVDLVSRCVQCCAVLEVPGDACDGEGVLRVVAVGLSDGFLRVYVTLDASVAAAAATISGAESASMGPDPHYPASAPPASRRCTLVLSSSPQSAAASSSVFGVAISLCARFVLTACFDGSVRLFTLSAAIRAGLRAFRARSGAGDAGTGDAGAGGAGDAGAGGAGDAGAGGAVRGAASSSPAARLTGGSQQATETAVGAAGSAATLNGVVTLASAPSSSSSSSSAAAATAPLAPSSALAAATGGEGGGDRVSFSPPLISRYPASSLAAAEAAGVELLHPIATYAHSPCVPVWCVAFNPHSSGIFLSGGRDNTAKIWSTMGTAAPNVTLAGHASDVTCVAFHANGMYAFTASSDKTVRVWDALTGDPVRMLLGHAAPLSALCPHPGGRWLASSDEAGRSIIWDVPAGCPAVLLPSPGAPAPRVARAAASLPPGAAARGTGAPVHALGWDDRDASRLCVADADGNVACWAAKALLERYDSRATLGVGAFALAPPVDASASPEQHAQGASGPDEGPGHHALLGAAKSKAAPFALSVRLSTRGEEQGSSIALPAAGISAPGAPAQTHPHDPVLLVTGVGPAL